MGAAGTWPRPAVPAPAGIGVPPNLQPGPGALHRRRLDAVSRWAVFTLIAAAIFLQRFGIVIGGESIFASFIIAYLVFILLLLTNRLRISSVRLALFLPLLLTFITSAVIWLNQVSLMSLFYFMSIYGLYIFHFSRSEGLFAYTRDLYLNCMILCGILGILQFFLQTVVPANFVFPIDSFAPGDILIPGFNWQIALEYGMPIRKANGVFFLEPSVFSQFTALALVAELVSRARLHRIAIYFTAMLASYSGTGIILLLSCVPWILLRQRHRKLFLLGGAVALLFIPAGFAFNLDFFVGRVGEFSTPESSGYMRFIAPLQLLRDYVVSDWVTLFFGNGPGTIMQFFKSLTYGVHDPTWAKILFEYGLFGALAFGMFMGTCLFYRSPDRWIGLGILVFLLFLGGNLVLAVLHVLYIGLLIWHGGGDEPAPAQEEIRDGGLVEAGPPPPLRHPA